MSAHFHAGQAVTVRAVFPPGHVRTPYYCRGRTGIVATLVGDFSNPEALAYGQPGAPTPLYRIRFCQADLWPDYAGNAADNLIIDIFEHWLQPAGGKAP
ncbi:MAG: nitrile hydratase subunit beta [Proteobacteria bacterium]|nr:nitrile hydratase subunit beta [Pseudomonadota bacterium]